jgi:hypothetical protein
MLPFRNQIESALEDPESFIVIIMAFICNVENVIMREYK